VQESRYLGGVESSVAAKSAYGGDFS